MGIKNKKGKPIVACADCQRENEKKKVYEVKPEFNAYSNKDRRISFLSIFSSLCNAYGKNDGTPYVQSRNLEETAYRVNEELYKHYPTEEK